MLNRRANCYIYYECNKNGHNNGVWTYNKTLSEQIQAGRKEGLQIIHRISISTFELEHLGVEVNEDGIVELPSSKGKPFEMYKLIDEKDDLKKSIESVLDELIDTNSTEEPFGGNTMINLVQKFKEWVDENSISDPRFIID